MNKRSTTTLKVYNQAEVDDMKAKGYITPRDAAAEAGTSLDLVYRAMRRRTIDGKEVASAVKVKLGKNCWNRYVHRAGWLEYVGAKRAQARERLGMASRG